MNLKNYLIIDRPGGNSGDQSNPLKLRIIKGFLRSDIDSVFSIADVFTPQGNNQDKLFFFPGCSVPRFKVRSLFTVTIKPAVATAAFISKQTLTGSDNTFIHYRDLYPGTNLDTNEFHKFMQYLNDSKVSTLFFSLLAGTAVDGFFLTPTVWNESSYDKSLSNHSTLSEAMKGASRWDFRNDCKNNQYQLLAPIPGSELHLMTCPVYTEESLLKHLNVGNIVIDEAKYREFRSFGEAGNEENLVLMMELMSNCDFEKSLIYLCFLLKEFGNKIANMKHINHVNFRSMLTFMGISDNNIASMSIHRMSMILQDHKLFTRSNAYRLSMLYAGENVNYTQEGSMYMAGPVLKPDFEKHLNDPQ